MIFYYCLCFARLRLQFCLHIIFDPISIQHSSGGLQCTVSVSECLCVCYSESIDPTPSTTAAKTHRDFGTFFSDFRVFLSSADKFQIIIIITQADPILLIIIISCVAVVRPQQRECTKEYFRRTAAGPADVSGRTSAQSKINNYLILNFYS